MNFLDSITPILFNTAVLITAFWLVKYIFSFYFFTLKKTEIVTIVSVISNLKLKLKTKLNLRLNSISNYGGSELKEVLTPLLENIKTINFDKPEDYQTILKKIIEINEAIAANKYFDRISDQKKNPIEEEVVSVNNSVAPELDMLQQTYESLFNFDKAIICIVVDIVKLTNDQITRTNEYNQFAEIEKNYKKITDMPIKIEIENFFFLEDLYNRHRKQRDELLEQKLADDNDDDLYSESA